MEISRHSVFTILMLLYVVSPDSEGETMYTFNLILIKMTYAGRSNIFANLMTPDPLKQYIFIVNMF